MDERSRKGQKASTHVSDEAPGDLQALQDDRAAGDLDDTSRSLPVKDHLPGILRTDSNVFCNREHISAAPCVGAIGEDEGVASTCSIQRRLQSPSPRRYVDCCQSPGHVHGVRHNKRLAEV